jgi:hypothetical protein
MAPIVELFTIRATVGQRRQSRRVVRSSSLACEPPD